MARQLRTWMSVYITTEHNILYGRCAEGKFWAYMHMSCIYWQDTGVWRGEGLSFICMHMYVWAVAKPHAKHEFTWILLILLTFLNFSEKKKEREDKEKMLRFSMSLVLFSLWGRGGVGGWRGSSELLFIIMWPLVKKKKSAGTFSAPGRKVSRQQTNVTNM